MVMEIGWTDVGSGGYILVSCAHSNTSYVCHRPVSCVSNIASFSGLSILDCPLRFSQTFIEITNAFKGSLPEFLKSLVLEINVREYRVGNQKKDSPEKLATWDTQDDEKHKTLCVGDHYTQTNIYNVNKT